MKIKMTETAHTSKVSQNRKEKHFYLQFTAINRELEPIIELRFYATQSTHYCCVWLQDRKHGIHLYGGGKARGYGFHRANAAAELALNDACIYLSEPISDVGYRAVEDAMIAIVHKLGYRKCNIIEAHA